MPNVTNQSGSCTPSSSTVPPIQVLLPLPAVPGVPYPKFGKQHTPDWSTIPPILVPCPQLVYCMPLHQSGSCIPHPCRYCIPIHVRMRVQVLTQGLNSRSWLQVLTSGLDSRSRFQVQIPGPDSKSELQVRTAGPDCRSRLQVIHVWCHVKKIPILHQEDQFCMSIELWYELDGK